jgi:hypothetical protein
VRDRGDARLDRLCSRSPTDGAFWVALHATVETRRSDGLPVSLIRDPPDSGTDDVTAAHAVTHRQPTTDGTTHPSPDATTDRSSHASAHASAHRPPDGHATTITTTQPARDARIP